MNLKSLLLSATVLFFLNNQSFAARQFVEAFDITAGSGAYDVAAADFNGDGNLDVAVADSQANAVQILLGGGNNTFQTGQLLPGVNQPSSVVVGDFNGDGKMDVAFNNFTTCIVSVFLGNGDGTFTAAPQASECAYSLAVGDFNGDGKLDIAAASVPIDILVGHGDGTFTSQYGGFSAPSAVIKIAAKDVNSDGKMDLVVSYGGLEVLLGNGNATFQQPIMVTLPSGEGCRGITVADFNNDGHADIAAPLLDSGGQGHTIVVFTGTGDGHFNLGNTYNVGLTPLFLTSADLNADGNIDLAVTDSVTNDVTILRGHGDGTFTSIGAFAVDFDPFAVIAADFNNDGKTDLLTANFMGNSVSLLPGTGQSFLGARDYAAGSESFDGAAGDFNGDGNLDVAIADLGSSRGSVSILLGDGHGHFLAPISIPSSPGANAIATADLNGDGKLDLVVSNSEFTGTGKDLTVLLGKGDGTFQPGVDYNLGGDGAFSVQLVDLNHDGKLDVVAAANGNVALAALAVLLGNGDGSFQAPLFTAEPGLDTLAAADLNGDGNIDLVLSLFGSNNGALGVVLGNGDGTFQPRTTFGANSGTRSLALGDLNGDGKPDLVSSGYPNNKSGILVFLNNGSGAFGAGTFYPAGDGSVTIADFNGDGKLDVISGFQLLPTAQLMYGNGDGTLQAGAHYDVAGTTTFLLPGDFNGDGGLDVAAIETIGRMTMLLNTNH